jgi:L-ascorbate metabolism protein UlaG (beta-lactamase superfamily)
MRLPALFRAVVAIACVTSCARERSPAWPASPSTPMTLTYLGVAGWQLDDGPHTLLVDPYFTRAEIADEHAPLSPDLAAIEAHSPRHVDAILVSHSHYDHLLDAPTIALRTGVGTAGTQRVARAAGVADGATRAVRGGDRAAFGPFSVRAIAALHSLVAGPDMPISDTVVLPMAAADYREGHTLQFLVEAEARSILFVSTANFVEGELVGIHPDIAIIAVGGRASVPDYTCRLLRAIGSPRRIFANHFDAHWKPLGAEQMAIGQAGLDGLARFADEVKACVPEATVVVPKHGEAMSI